MSKNFRANENVVGTGMENIELENGSTEILIPKNIGIMENGYVFTNLNMVISDDLYSICNFLP